MPERQPEVLLEADVVERIRTIFLQPRPHVSIAEGTALLGWTRSEMSEAIRSGEIEVERTCVLRQGAGPAFFFAHHLVFR